MCYPLDTYFMFLYPKPCNDYSIIRNNPDDIRIKPNCWNHFDIIWEAVSKEMLSISPIDPQIILDTSTFLYTTKLTIALRMGQLFVFNRFRAFRRASLRKNGSEMCPKRTREMRRKPTKEVGNEAERERYENEIRPIAKQTRKQTRSEIANRQKRNRNRNDICFCL